MDKSLAYISGYIDGDGCFFLNKENCPLKYRAQIVISSTNEAVLKTFRRSFKGSIYLTSKRKDHWKRTFHWIMRGLVAKNFTFEILPYLIEKNGDAQIFVEYVETKSKFTKEELIYKMTTHRESMRQIDETVIAKLRKIKPKGVSNDLDYPYLAGFIDAECCLGISKYKPKNRPNFIYKISLQCTNTNPTIFFWLMERFGGSITHVKRNFKNPNHRDQIIWNLTSEALYLILPKIFPHLRSKKSVCKKLMELHETIIPNGGDRQSKDFKESYEAVLSSREQIVQQVHHLNSKGIKNV